MADQVDSVDKIPSLPPGWECRYDHRTGRYYYINHFTKETTWEDPRQRYKQLQSAPIPAPAERTQPTHGSPYHVYPANNAHPVQTAFQLPAEGSPIIGAKNLSHIPARFTPPPRPMSALAARLQESSLNSAADTELAVSKISAMFPTVSDTHIRILLKKYYNREAVVISALQVEKHPITTPGPFATPPPSGRHFHAAAMGVVSALQMTPPLSRDSRSGSPITRIGSPIPRPGSGASGTFIGSPRVGDGYRNSPRPHSSPKMKLRYLKSVFPKVEETLLLDILANSDNNVQKASEKLIAMGYDKRDTVPPRLSLRKKEEEKKEREKEKKLTPTPPPRMKSVEEKNKIKIRLQVKYRDIPDRVIAMALDSVDYSEEKAGQILDIVVQEEAKPRTSSQESTPSKSDRSDSAGSASGSSAPIVEASPQMEPSPTIETAVPKQVKRPKARKESAKSVQSPSPLKDEYRSVISRGASGANPTLSRGPNDELLLADYVTWNGANPDMSVGLTGLARGPDGSLRSDRGYVALGPNTELCKGPKSGLAKGSMYSQINARPIVW